MSALQLIVLAVASYCLISCVWAEGIVGREYLPVAAAVVPRKIPQYSYRPVINQYQPTYPQYVSTFYPQYNGFLGGHLQQAVEQQFTTLPNYGLGSYYPNLNLVTGLKPRVDVIDTVYDANGAYVYGKKK